MTRMHAALAGKAASGSGSHVLTESHAGQMTTRVAIQNERPALPKDMPREYSEIINRCAHQAKEIVP